ncbi:hypothetical protein DKG74_17120 [Zavarzinia aquatilis]|uniref:Peptidase M20 dimerisation domain-containing protein n=2 Tax=Zavarzinia aquatilis TaxID=2211142 RepID=A0A317DYH9_9PROT|nr:hypothetical protein DKG74_17120 [Zavarzinia aquatilis]
MPSINAVELTQALVRLHSVNPPGNESACAQLVGNLLEDAGFDVGYHSFGPGRVNVVARIGECSELHRPLCLTGHLDTVPIGAADWSVDPFGGEIVDGLLYGRGASDMKSGVAAMVAAAMSAAASLREAPGLLLVLTAGEETGCEGASHLANLDGVLGTAGAIVVGEPTGNRLRLGHKGALWLMATCQGRAAHGSMPDLGINAIYRGATVIGKLRDFGFNRAPHAELGGPTLNVGTVRGGANVNSVPDRAEIGIDIRTVPGMAHDRIIEDLRRYLAPDLHSLDQVLDLESVWTSPHDPLMRRWAGRVDAPPDDVCLGLPFFTDASILKPAFGGIPTLILGPGETHMAHQTDEYCRVERIGEAAAIYLDLIADWQDQARHASAQVSA